MFLSCIKSDLMFRPIQEAFDAGYLCFVPDRDGEHRLHLLGSTLNNVKLSDVKRFPWVKLLGQDNVAKEAKKQDMQRAVK